LYADGVNIGLNGKANVAPVLMTLGCFLKELYKPNYGKMVIGYIDRLTDISEEELINHLMIFVGKGVCQVFKGSIKYVFYILE